MLSRNTPAKRLTSGLFVLALTLSGLVSLSAPAQAADTKSITISGFAPNSTVLTKTMRAKINNFIKSNPSYDSVSCVGFADRPGTKTANNKLGKNRALAGCRHAVKRDPNLEIVKTSGLWENSRAGSSVRKVRIVLSRSADAQITTYFEYMGGVKGIELVKTAVGESITLPTPSKTGYVFLGWFSDQYNGKKYGDGGDSYIATKTRTLWAQWYVPSASTQPNLNCSVTNPFVSLNGKTLAWSQQEGDSTEIADPTTAGSVEVVFSPTVDNIEFDFTPIDDAYETYLNEEGLSLEDGMLLAAQCFSSELKWGTTTLQSFDDQSETVAPGFYSTYAYTGGAVVRTTPLQTRVRASMAEFNGGFRVFLNYDEVVPRDRSNDGPIPFTLTFTWGDFDYVFDGATYDALSVYPDLMPN